MGPHPRYDRPVISLDIGLEKSPATGMPDVRLADFANLAEPPCRIAPTRGSLTRHFVEYELEAGYRIRFRVVLLSDHGRPIFKTELLQKGGCVGIADDQRGMAHTERLHGFFRNAINFACRKFRFSNEREECSQIRLWVDLVEQRVPCLGEPINAHIGQRHRFIDAVA